MSGWHGLYLPPFLRNPQKGDFIRRTLCHAFVMLPCSYYNPVRCVFGQDTIAQVTSLIPADARVLLTYGGGSIKRNGVYTQIVDALVNHTWYEKGGIEPNPSYETLCDILTFARENTIDFFLAAGGGSVIDGTKFLAAATAMSSDDPWTIVTGETPIRAATPLGVILTIPAAGSEMNPHAVISRTSPPEKRGFSSEYLFPRFCILDPSVTFSLPQRQVRNCIVDPFVHVCEQYLTFPVNAPVQDAYAAALLRTLTAIAPRTLEEPDDYDARATLMWCATQALNGIIAAGVPEDWATHAIGHELTALYGIDHAASLAVVLPALLTHQFSRKKEKLCHCAEHVWHITTDTADARAHAAIAQIVQFFRACGMPTSLAEAQLPDDAPHAVATRLAAHNVALGEHQDISAETVRDILLLSQSNPSFS